MDQKLYAILEENSPSGTVVYFLSQFITVAFTALMLLVGQQEGHPAGKKLSGGVLPWLSAWGEVQICIWPS